MSARSVCSGSCPCSYHFDRAFGLDLRHARVREALLQTLAQRQVFVQQLGVLAVRVPARSPRLVEAEAESKRVNLLAHVLSSATLNRIAYRPCNGSPYSSF